MMRSVVARTAGVSRGSRASIEAARRLWAGESAATASPEVVVAAIERARARLRLGLGRWIGVDGYGVLLERVLEEADTENATDEAPEKIRNFVAVVALLMDRLSQVIGEELAIRLVEQAWIASPNDKPVAEIRGTRDVQETRSR